MGSLPAELSLDYRPKPTNFLPKTITDFISEVSTIGDASLRLSKLDDLINKLQEESKKIEAFKRELPLCMQLLNDVITALKMESVQCSAQAAAAATTTKPLLKEFSPWKKNSDEEEEEETKIEKEVDSKDKKNWLSSVQLWNVDDDDDSNNNKNIKRDLKLEFKKNEARTENMFQSCKSKNGEKSFLQFSACPPQPLQEKVELPVNGLSLLSPLIKNSREKSSTACGRGVASSGHVSQSNLRNGVQQQPARKQRRCWSPELHRRFVNALQQLGGSQAATPKQIRELMQVDGLTNDEVKSHLQKYRLHTRRVPTPPSSTGKEPMVVLGGLWMSRDQGGESSKASTSQSGSPEGPLQLGGSTAATSITGCNSMEDDEDEKSEIYSWRSNVHKPGKDDV